jgi:DNA-binding transcriptional LysR family regulator
MIASARRLAVFKSVVEYGGFNAAANRLGIAQPSVSAHVKALERRIGQPLFHRHRGARPVLTRAGEALYDYTVEALSRAAAASHTLADLRAQAEREVVIALHRDLVMHVLPARLAAFRQQHPKLRVVTRIGTIEDVLELVRTNAALFGIMLAEGAISGLHSEVLAREPLILVAAPNHPLTKRRRVSAAELSRYPFVMGLRGSRYFQLTETALRRLGLSRYDIAMEMQESTAVKEMVRHGAGLACLPRCTVLPEIKVGTLVEIDHAGPLQILELRCAYRLPLSPLAERFLSYIRAKGQSLPTVAFR